MKDTQDYNKLRDFWDSVFVIDEESKKEAEASVNVEEDWKEYAVSPKLFSAMESFGSKEKVLDYGCGEGWAAIIAAKSGCNDVTGVEVAQNAVEAARFNARLFELEDRISIKLIDDKWIENEDAGKYDGIFCSNVIDVVPEDMAAVIIENLARIAKKGASVIIAMNYCGAGKPDPEHGKEVVDGYKVYVNGVLRLVSRTDEEWSDIFGRYFKIVRLDHYSWPGEEKEARRLFFLEKE